MLDANQATADKPVKCGVIMPISAMDGYTADHWDNVKTILFESIKDAGFQPDLVSDSEEVTVIQKNIVHNIYSNEIVVCDISGRNANVMFELGMRLTFDKAVVVVKDDATNSPFDTNIIEYVQYRKDLRYTDMLAFKTKLKSKIVATHNKRDEPNYSPFIKHFGDFLVPRIQEKEVDASEYVFEELKALRADLASLQRDGTMRKPWEIGDLPITKVARTKAMIEQKVNEFLSTKKYIGKDDSLRQNLSDWTEEFVLLNPEFATHLSFVLDSFMLRFRMRELWTLQERVENNSNSN